MNSTPRAPVVAWLAVLLAVAACALWAWSEFGAPDDLAAPPSGTIRSAESPVTAAVPAVAAGDAPVAVYASRDRVAEPAATDAAAGTAPLRGRVVDSRGLLLAGVPIAVITTEAFLNSDAALRVSAAACAATSDAQGRFAIDRPASDDRVVPVAGPGWFTLRSTDRRTGDGDGERLVVAAKGIAVSGRVVRRDDAAPLAGVAVWPSLLLLAEFPRPLDDTCVPPPCQGHSDANGDYRLPLAPIAAGVDLLFTCPGFEPLRVPSVGADRGRLDVALVPTSDRPGRIRGLVHDADGPVGDAALRLGNDQTTRPDAHGAFSFAFPRHASRLVATRRGWMPVVLDGIGVTTPEVDVAFVRRALTIAGEVRHADGTPAVGFRVDLADAIRDGDDRPVELACRDDPTAVDCFAVTDVKGRFTVGGLGDRTYRLFVYEPKTLVSITSAPIAAGTNGVVLMIPADACFAVLRGTVVDRGGRPIAGAFVHSWLKPPSAAMPVGGSSVAADADGRFEFAALPRQGVQLGASKEGYLYAVRPIERWTMAGDDLRIELLRLCSVRVEGDADLTVRFLDGDGRPVHAESHSQTTTYSTDALTLRNGTSPVMEVPESTATMVWWRAGREVGRKAVFVDPAADAVTLLIAAH